MAHTFGIIRFVREQWLCVGLVCASAAILTFTGYAGDIGLHLWRNALHEQIGNSLEYLPPLSEWLARNYGMNEFDLLDTHFCFAWLFCIFLIACTFASEGAFRQRFFSGFILLWFLILVFWSFLLASAALPFLYGTRAFHRPSAIIPTLNKVGLCVLPVLLILLLIFRATKGLTMRWSELRAARAARSRSP